MAEQLFETDMGIRIFSGWNWKRWAAAFILGGKRCHSKFGYPPEIGHIYK